MNVKPINSVSTAFIGPIAPFSLVKPPHKTTHKPPDSPTHIADGKMPLLHLVGHGQHNFQIHPVFKGPSLILMHSNVDIGRITSFCLQRTDVSNEIIDIFLLQARMLTGVAKFEGDLRRERVENAIAALIETASKRCRFIGRETLYLAQVRTAYIYLTLERLVGHDGLFFHKLREFYPHYIGAFKIDDIEENFVNEVAGGWPEKDISKRMFTPYLIHLKEKLPWLYDLLEQKGRNTP